MQKDDKEFIIPGASKKYRGSNAEVLAKEIVADMGKEESFRESKFQKYANYVISVLGGILKNYDEKVIKVSETLYNVMYVRSFLERISSGFRVETINPYCYA